MDPTQQTFIPQISQNTPDHLLSRTPLKTAHKQTCCGSAPVSKTISDYSVSSKQDHVFVQAPCSMKEVVKAALRKCGFDILYATSSEILFDSTTRTGCHENRVDRYVNEKKLRFLLEAVYENAETTYPQEKIFPVLREKAGTDYLSITWKEAEKLNTPFPPESQIRKVITANLGSQDTTFNTLIDVDMCEACIAGKNDVDFLSTGDIHACHAVVLWDRATQAASLCHYVTDHITPEALKEQLQMLLRKGSKQVNIEAKIVGGHTIRMGWESGFFFCIEPTLRELNIPITETFLGDIEDRPRRIIFNLETGEMNAFVANKKIVEQSRLNKLERGNTAGSFKFNQDYRTLEASVRKIRIPVVFQNPV